MFIVGLFLDLGLPWRIWHPMVMWNPHSVLFEVAWCVMLYTTVLSIDVLIMALERFKKDEWVQFLRNIYVVFIVAGIMLSTLHQSSLGALYLLMPEKMSELWATNAIGPLFFTSAVIGGLSIVTLESIISSWAYNRRLELDLLSSLSKGLGMALLVYFAMKVTDLYARRVTVWQLDWVHFWFYVELFGTVALPALLITFREIRESRRGAALDCRFVCLWGPLKPLQCQPHLLWRLSADLLFSVHFRDYYYRGHGGRRRLDLRFPEPEFTCFS